MSRAFVKEDVDIPERSTRRRAASGLPPGALNYMTADGALRMRSRLNELQGDAEANNDAIAHLEHTLASATIVEPQVQPNAVTFGARVTLQGEDGRLASYRIVGADEVDLDPGNVSWASDAGKLLLSATPGQKLKLPGATNAVQTLIKIE